jgi:ADP-heptose:LPS heptosyltransferase
VKKFDTNVVLVGQSQPWTNGVKKVQLPRVINLIDKTSTPEMISLCSLAKLVITPDTGTLHIAGALKKKTIGIFGNINPRTRISYYPTVKAIYPHGDLKCIPCWDLHPCKLNGAARCMNLTTPKKILSTVAEMM